MSSAVVCANWNSQRNESRERRFEELATGSSEVAQPDKREGDKIVKSYLEVHTLPPDIVQWPTAYSASVLCASVLPDTQGRQPL